VAMPTQNLRPMRSSQWAKESEGYSVLIYIEGFLINGDINPADICLSIGVHTSIEYASPIFHLHKFHLSARKEKKIFRQLIWIRNYSCY